MKKKPVILSFFLAFLLAFASLAYGQINLPDASSVKAEIDLSGSHNPIAMEEFGAEQKNVSVELVETQRLLQKAQAIHRANETRAQEAREQLDKARGKEAISTRMAALITRDAWKDSSAKRLELLGAQVQMLTTHRSVWQHAWPFMLGQSDYFAIVEIRTALRNSLENLAAVRTALDPATADAEHAIGDLSTRMAALPEGSELTKALQSNINALEAQIKETQTTVQRAKEIEAIEKRLLYQVQEYLKRPSLKDLGARTVHLVRSVWGFQVLTVERSSLTIGKIILAVVILFFGFLFSARLTDLFGLFLSRRFNANPSATLIFKKLLFYLFVIFSWLFALHVVSIPLTLFAFLGGAFAVAIGFGAQTLFNNFISGLIILIERPFQMNDLVEIDGKIGRVMNIGARCSLIRLPTGVDFLVPNSTFLEKNVINWTHADKKVRATVKVGVAYGSPTKEVARLLLQAVETEERVVKEPVPYVLFSDFGDNTLQFDLLFWTILETDSTALSRLTSDIRFRIDELFQGAGIVMAFPQRDVHLDAAKPLEVRVIAAK